ncbi:FixH family protein [Pseudonocardia aurantiaca]|uniref:YtkA-like domain-containing protein n=1 Tax=Pseudonocardia aurantiaca TaxID=75290 RepID=A0ABW4FK43_9PSEU
MTVRGRWGVAVTALAVVTALALLLWPHPAGPVDVAGAAGRHQVRLVVETPAVGARDLTVEITGPEPVDRLVVAAVMAEMGHAAVPVTAVPVTAAPVAAGTTAPGRFRAAGVEFFMAGRWDVAVTVHGPDGAVEVVLPVLITS